MWQNLFELNLSPLNLIVRAIIVYLVIVVLFRISGKRQLGQMGVTEFVVILLISNGVQNSMNGGDNSLLGGVIIASVLVLLSTGISYLTFRHAFFRNLFEGTPTLLVHKGKIIEKHLRRERMSESELRTLLRKQGCHQIGELDTAVLEADGTLTVTRANTAST